MILGKRKLWFKIHVLGSLGIGHKCVYNKGRSLLPIWRSNEIKQLNSAHQTDVSPTEKINDKIAIENIANESFEWNTNGILDVSVSNIHFKGRTL